ncbi:GlxA family transcriptional regulator [Streptomyces sp. NPDC051217]|uniref:GlxA family transcriptional regulator n=1 Tax=Streptomyces sp. NPDC051217 TaxID=3365644 RepID=UPI0037A03561
MASPGGNPITCGSGLTLQSQQPLERLTGPLDTLIVSGGLGHERAAADSRLVGHVRRLAKESRRVASVCTGASILAATGLLDGRRATTHWRYASQLAAQHPAITVDFSPIYIRDGDVYTAAGITSALDLTLAFIEDDHGAELTRQVARDLVTYLQRPGNQAQMSLWPRGAGSVRPRRCARLSPADTGSHRRATGQHRPGTPPGRAPSAFSGIGPVGEAAVTMAGTAPGTLPRRGSGSRSATGRPAAIYVALRRSSR